ncbi:MAG: DUF5718 family protein [Hydrogenovibrio sp.]|nr:DUF5718 family protein [Hydrogenovibrio sp.]
MTLTDAHLKRIPVFGIAGNFAEHLSQAGEDADFVNVKTKEANAPKGIFPIYLPDADSFLGTFPLSSSRIEADFSEAINLHMEPEACVLFDVEYDGDQVIGLHPKAFSAFNDCSIRRPNATKISQKKNWGEACTGLSEHWIEMDSLQPGGTLDAYHITSMIRRNGEILQYGVDSPTTGYQYFHQKLLDWIMETFNQQADFGPLEPLHDYLHQMDHPKEVIVSLGATRYTSFGETGFLQPGDEIGIFVYNHETASESDAIEHFSKTPDSVFDKGCYLHQFVYQA